MRMYLTSTATIIKEMELFVNPAPFCSREILQSKKRGDRQACPLC